MITLLTNEFPPHAGGIATYCYELTRALVDTGQDITVIATDKKLTDPDFDKRFAFPVVRVPENRLAPLRHANRFISLWRSVRANRPEVIMASDWRTGLIILPLARHYGIPYSVTSYGTEVLAAAASPYRRKIALTVYKHAQVVLSISQYTKQLLIDLGVASNKVVVTPLGIDPSLYEPDPIGTEKVIRRHGLQDKKVILTLARLTPRKGQDTMLRAMPRVLESVPSAVYIIAGRGDDEQRLRQLVTELGLESHVIFAGYVDDSVRQAYYQACDLYVMLSRQEGNYVEGFGLTLLEAGACSKLVVAGRHGGVPEVVHNGETGKLVDPLNTEEVAAAVTELLTNDELTIMGQKARERIVRTADWSTTAQLTVKQFQTFLGAKQN